MTGGIALMAATFGRVEEFDSKKEEWSQYMERLQHFFVANDIVDAEKKRAVFLIGGWSCHVQTPWWLAGSCEARRQVIQ